MDNRVSHVIAPIKNIEKRHSQSINYRLFISFYSIKQILNEITCVCVCVYAAMMIVSNVLFVDRAKITQKAIMHILLEYCGHTQHFHHRRHHHRPYSFLS